MQRVELYKLSAYMEYNYILFFLSKIIFLYYAYKLEVVNDGYSATKKYLKYKN